MLAAILLHLFSLSSAELSTVSVSASGEQNEEDAPGETITADQATEATPLYRSVIESGDVSPAALLLKSEADELLREERYERAIGAYGSAIDALLPSIPPGRSLAWPSHEDFAVQALIGTARAQLASGRPEDALKTSRAALALPFALTREGREKRGEALSAAIESLTVAGTKDSDAQDGEESRKKGARELLDDAVAMGYLSPLDRDRDETRDKLLKAVDLLGYDLPSSIPSLEKSAEAAEKFGADIIRFVQNAAVFDDFDDALSGLRSSIVSSGVHVTIPTPDGRHAMYGTALGYLLFTMKDEGPVSTDPQSPHLRAFLSVLDLLVDDLGAPIDQRTAAKGASKRPPLHLVARAGSPVAVRAMLGKGADPNLRDGEGWTALMATCMVESKGEVEQGRVDTARALLDAGARWNDANYEGKTALHIAAEGLQGPLVQLLLERGADPSLRTVYGQTVLGLVYQNMWANGDAAHACAEILFSRLRKAGLDIRHQQYMNEEGKAAEFMSLLQDTLSGAAEHHAGSADEQERGVMAALMRYVRLSPDLLGSPVTKDSGNWYGELHSRVTSLIPDAYWRIYRSDTGPTEDELDLIQSSDGTAGEAAEVADYETGIRSIDRGLLRSEAFSTFRERGAYASLMDSFTMLAMTPTQHSVAFAVPSDDALRGIARHSPLVEVGAGTGYWSAALRAVTGADVVAYDPHPTADTNNPHFQEWAYGEVREGECATMFRGEDGPELAQRSLLLVWPNNADTQDNTHLDVTDTGVPIWDAECLEAFVGAGGKKVVYVGERREAIGVIEDAAAPDWGFTSSRRFQALLTERFDLVEQFDCPQWFLNEDDVTVWQKKV